MNTDANNVILNMPFDESDGSAIAYDYSQSRADGQVFGAGFVAGKNGNAIRFTGGDTCEIENGIIPDLAMEFSLLMWVQAGEMECGSTDKLTWLLNFQGLENYIEVPVSVKPGTWFSLALTHRGSEFDFYVNSSLIQTVNNADALLGISLNQDYYGGEYGFGLLDDVKCYNVALSQNEIISELSISKVQAYRLDGVDFKEYGVYVSDSEGVVNRPKLKNMATVSWDNYHGDSVDLQHKFYEPREITLSCFIKAESKNDFIAKLTAFERLFDNPGTTRLVIDVHTIKPLIYEVYCKDEISVAKKWNDDLMVGMFKLKLIEPEPLKRVLKHMRLGDATKTCTITLTTTKLVNIYWGDGSVDYDISGENLTVSHEYTQNGDYFPVVTGCIDEISSFTTNSIVVWNRL
jgi:hypothetical protein